LGPFKGGLRFYYNVYSDECKALATWISLKCSLQNITFGWAKGGIKFDKKAIFNEWNRKNFKRIL